MDEGARARTHLFGGQKGGKGLGGGGPWSFSRARLCCTNHAFSTSLLRSLVVDNQPQERGQSKAENPLYENYVAQRYVSNPMLVGGRKVCLLFVGWGMLALNVPNWGTEVFNLSPLFSTSPLLV